MRNLFTLACFLKNIRTSEHTIRQTVGFPIHQISGRAIRTTKTPVNARINHFDILPYTGSRNYRDPSDTIPFREFPEYTLKYSQRRQAIGLSTIHHNFMNNSSIIKENKILKEQNEYKDKKELMKKKFQDKKKEIYIKSQNKDNKKNNYERKNNFKHQNKSKNFFY